MSHEKGYTAMWTSAKKCKNNQTLVFAGPIFSGLSKDRLIVSLCKRELGIPKLFNFLVVTSSPGFF